MILNVYNNSAYLVAPKARSRATGYFQLNSLHKLNHHQTINGSICVEYKTLRYVVSSAAEAEITRVYHNTPRAILIQIILNGLDHPQPPTPVKTNNYTTNGFIYDNITFLRYGKQSAF